MKPTDSRCIYRMKQILDHLAEKDMTRAQLAAAMHVTRQLSLKAYLNFLEASRKLHVAGWTPPEANGVRWAVYRFGPGYSKRRPRPKKHAEVMRDYWQRQGRKPRCQPAPQTVADPFAALFM